MAKRIQSACLYETIRFEAPSELIAYRAGLARKKVRYAIDSEETQQDGSVVIRIRRQFNAYTLGSYLD